MPATKANRAKKLSNRRRGAVLIAKDCLKQLRSHKLQIASGSGYLTEDDDFPIKGQLQEHIDEAQAHCTVCAIGGLFLQFVRQHNKVECLKATQLDKRDICRKMAPFFTASNLDDVEAAFEGRSWLHGDGEVFRGALGAAACRLSDSSIRRYTKSADRLTMITICENIIRNDGVFDINDVPEAQE